MLVACAVVGESNGDLPRRPARRAAAVLEINFEIVAGTFARRNSPATIMPHAGRFVAPVCVKAHKMEKVELRTGVEYFGAQANRWSGLYRCKPAFRDRLALFLEGLTRYVAPPARILDFGCGSGVMSMSLADMKYDVHGVDGSQRMVEIADLERDRRKITNAQFTVMNAGEFEPPANPYDAIVCSSVVQYVEDDRKLIRNFAAALRPGGALLISVPHARSMLGRIEDATGRLVRMGRFSGRGFMDYSLRRYDKSAFIRQLSQYGFGAFECTYFEVPLLGSIGIPLSRVGAFGVMLLVAARKEDRALARRLPSTDRAGMAVGRSPARSGRGQAEPESNAAGAEPATARLGFGGLCSALLCRIILSILYSSGLILHGILGPLGRFRNAGRPATNHEAERRTRILVIGTFYSTNWTLAHLKPLAAAESVEKVIAVADRADQPIDKVEYDPPPRWLALTCSRAAAKLIWSLRRAVLDRPDLVMGYHLFPGALSALLVARASGARSAYQATGGPTEIIGGGVQTENFLLRNLRVSSPFVEALATMIVRRFDLIVVRGASAKRFMKSRGLGGLVEVVPGSIDGERFTCHDAPRDIDVVWVGRLVPFKQPEHLLRVVARLRAARPELRAVMVGQGALQSEMEALARDLGITDNLRFLGHVEEVEAILRRSKVFLLTSRSEGLSIAMAEAMAAGVVPVVAHVGDLGDLVRNGETGWLVTPGNFDEYSERIEGLLNEPHELKRYSAAARAAAVCHNEVGRVAARWSRSIRHVCANPKSTRPDDRPATLPRSKSYSPLKLWQAVPWTVKRGLQPFFSTVRPAVWLGRRFRATSRFARRADRWDGERAREYQLAQVRRICELAFTKSPFYAARMRACGFAPGDLKSLEDLRRLPTLDRDVVQDNAVAMCTRGPVMRGVDSVSTGGTGGKPLQFYADSNRSAVEYAYLVASWSRAGYAPIIPQAVLRGEVVPENGRGFRHQFDPLFRRHYYSVFHMTDENMRRYLEHMATIGPCFLLVYPSSVSALTRYIERSGFKPPGNIRGVLAGSEIVYPEDRARVERVFGVRYFSWYGHSEKLVLAAECEFSSEYHVWPSYGYFELLDAQGRPVTRPGQRGEIVGTGFINSTMPFIRYRTGDFATYVGPRCNACGREHPVISDIRGHRTQETLVAADGSLISWTALNMHDDTFDFVRQFQFAQTTPGRATLRLVAAEGFESESMNRIRSSLNRKLEGRIEFDIARVDSIALTRAGKPTFVDQQIDLDGDISKVGQET